MNRLERYGQRINSHDLVKLMALLFMVIDHIGQFLFPEIIWFRLLGRGAMPLFFFLIGFHGKLHISISLLIFGVILTFDNWLLYYIIYFNILLNFALSYLVFKYFKLSEQSTAILVLVFLIASLLNFYIYPRIEYGTIGLMFMVSAQLLNKKAPYAFSFLIYTLVFYFFWESMIFNFFTPQGVLTALMVFLGLLFYLMLSYQLETYESPPTVSLPIRVLSRYSLEVYFLHLMAFHLLAYFKLI